MSVVAFHDDPHLHSRVSQALNDSTQRQLLLDVTEHVQRLQDAIADLNSQLQAARQPASSGFATANLPIAHAQTPAQGGAEPPLKKRKLPAASNGGGDSAWRTGAPILIARDVSFSVPMRKKMGLDVVGSMPGASGGLRIVTQGTRELEGGISWDDIEQVIAVPVPEKAQPTTNFVVVPKATSDAEALVWTIPGTGLPKNWLYSNPDGQRPVEETYQAALETVLNKELATHGLRVTTPSADHFVSNVVQSHRKGEKNWHVKAWLGSKEGFIYALPTGILFGFKKPILFFPFSNITSISYTSVLQRTFNLVISASELDATDSRSLHDKDYEFAMLDQTDFAPLDGYVKKHGLNDASLAASRRAQSTAKANARASAVATNGNGDGDGADGGEQESELSKAERELQDAEDEEEEDFDPGSGGESDGSGTDSDEEDEGQEVPV